MIIKRIHIVLFIGILTGFCYCGSGKQFQQQAIMDIHGGPISFFLKDGKVIYYTEDDKKIMVNASGVEFNGGRDSLSTYLLKKYVSHASYNYAEYNVYERFFILFDKNLNIKEVRIMYRKYADNERFYYDSIFIDAIKSTTGMWHKTVGNEKWYLYFHNQRIY